MSENVQPVLFLSLLFFYVTLFQFVGLAKANPMYSSMPIEPNKDLPMLVVQSPRNAIYWNMNEVMMKLTVTQPDSWNESSRIKEIRYILDGELIVLWNGNHGTHHGAPSIDYYLPQTSHFSAVMGDLCYGQHILNVTVCTECDYFPNLPDYKFPTIYKMTVSKALIFTVYDGNYIPEFPSWIFLVLFFILTLFAFSAEKHFFGAQDVHI